MALRKADAQPVPCGRFGQSLDLANDDEAILGGNRRMQEQVITRSKLLPSPIGSRICSKLMIARLLWLS